MNIKYFTKTYLNKEIHYLKRGPLTERPYLIASKNSGRCTIKILTNK